MLTSRNLHEEDINGPTDGKLRTRLQYKIKTIMGGAKCNLRQTLYRQLHSDGFVVIKKAIRLDEREIEKLTKYVRSSRETSKIFNNPEKNDGLRRQVSINPIPEIEQLLTKMFPEKIIRDWYLIRSLKNCKQQMAHCDYRYEKLFLICF